MRSSLTRKLALLLSATGLVMSGCDTPLMVADDRGFDPEGLVPFAYHWEPGHEIAIFVDTRNEPAGFDLEKAVNAGIGMWKSAALVGEVRMKIVNDVHSADVIVHHADAGSLVTIDTNICPTPADLGGGRTYFCVVENSSGALRVPILGLNDGSGGRVKMDVRINVGAITDPDFFEAVVTHELGHVLGIGAHSPEATDIMFGTPRVRSPSADDIATLRHVLSRPAEVRF